MKYLLPVMPRTMFLFVAITSVIFAMLAAAEADAAEARGQLADARGHYLAGRYEEAQEAFAKLTGEQAVDAAIGIARCQIAVGKYDEAEKRLGDAIAKDGEARLYAELACLQFQRGDYEAAGNNCRHAIAKDKQQLLAHWIQAELDRATGKLDAAQKGYEWFVDYYNNADKIDDAESLHLVGLAAAQYARWTRNSKQFRFLVNRLYPQALELEKDYWPARLAAGRLFLEKFNQRDATREFNAALAINPNAAEIHAARAELALQSFDLDRAATAIERALEINPNFLPALWLKADLLMADFRVADAIAALEKARQLNPRSAKTLGRLAAGYLFADGESDADAAADAKAPSRFDKLVDAVQAGNPHCGEFYEVLGDTLDLLRKYPAAERYYGEARARMPQLIGVPGKLGMVQMRLGEEAHAKKMLEESFAADPFNVRVKNSLEVLDVLDGYAVIETEHFAIKFDRGQDQMLAEYAAEYLEHEVYPRIVEDFGYAPRGKTLFEIFSRAKNTSGHGWFSARMVGLPYVGTVGACAGQMVALASPNDMPEPFNWARVLGHEFVHVVNLQQTDFNIPHWFTEALAVRSEGYPRPPEWTRLLARRRAAGTLFTLDDINHGFFRPGAGDDWTLAYCQAEIYAEYMVERFGDAALAKMLAAYADHLSTPAAIERCFGVTQAEFERGYRQHVARLVAGVAAEFAADGQSAKSLIDLQKAAADDPENADVLAALAQALLNRNSNTDARRYALAALKIDKRQQLAAYVMARLYLSIGDAAAAVKYLADSFQPDAPQTNHLALLAGIAVRAKQYERAEKLYTLGAEKFPHDDAWLKRLASVYLKTGENNKLAPVLKQLAALDTESLAYRKKLAELALSSGDFDQAEHWAQQALYIDIEDAPLHALRANALAAQQKHAAAAKEYVYALRIDPKPLSWRLELAEVYAAAGKNDEARLELEKILASNAEFPGARELLEKLIR